MDPTTTLVPELTVKERIKNVRSVSRWRAACAVLAVITVAAVVKTRDSNQES